MQRLRSSANNPAPGPQSPVATASKPALVCFGSVQGAAGAVAAVSPPSIVLQRAAIKAIVSSVQSAAPILPVTRPSDDSAARSARPGGRRAAAAAAGPGQSLIACLPPPVAISWGTEAGAGAASALAAVGAAPTAAAGRRYCSTPHCCSGGAPDRLGPAQSL